MPQRPHPSSRMVARPPRPSVEPPRPRSVTLPPLPPAHERGDHVGYLVGALGSFGLVAVMVVGAHGKQLVVALAAVVLSIAGVGLAALVGARRARSRAGRRRRRWMELADLRVAEVEAAAVTQRSALDAPHPRDVAGMRARAHGGEGLWERRPDDVDRMTFGVGRAARPAHVTVVTDGLDSGLDSPDEVCLRAAKDAADRAASVVDCPVTIDLLAGGLAVVGPVDEGRALVRWLIAAASVARPADELAVGVVSDDIADSGVWAWLRWLPHAHDPSVPDGTATSIAGTVRELADLFRPAPVDRLVIIDHPLGEDDSSIEALQSSFVVLAADDDALPPGVSHRIDLHDAVLRTPDGRREVLDVICALSQQEAEDVARAMTPLRLAGRAPSHSRERSGGLGALLGLGADAAFDPPRRWAERRETELLRTPLGRDQDGAPKWLDLRESAAGGMGPHGLVVGATGTGKSEVLRTLVTGLVARHSPDELALLLVDFKGGAAFDPFAALPHVAGLVTNLADDAALIVRVCQALEGEMADRQEKLRRAGADSVRGLWRSGASCPPSLLVVVDEFSELLTAWPDALDVLLSVGRLGRSLGIHLVLATQRWEEGRLRGLEAHLRWRLCLRTFTVPESMAVLGTAAATALPAVPGAALLAVDGVLSPVQVGFSGAAARTGNTSVRTIRRLSLRPPSTPRQSTQADGSDPGTSERDVVVQAIMASDVPAAEQIWLPPLGSRTEPLAPGAVAVVDRPRRRRQEPLVLDPLTAGPVAVVGAPGSGVSGALGVLAARSSCRAGVVVLACGGSGLAALDEDPAVLAWADPGDPDHATAVLDSVLATADHLAADHLAGAVLPAPLLLVVDGLARARQVVEDLDARLTRIASAAGSGMVGLVVGAQRWGDLRGDLRDLVPTRFELRLADPADSLHRRATAATLAGAPTGRGLTTDGELMQWVAPAARSPLRVARAGRRRIEPLPTVARPGGGGFAVRAGDLAPVRWSPDDGHLVVLGDRGSGRSTALRELIRTRSSGRVLVVDPRCSLEGVVGGHGIRRPTGDAVAAELATVASECAAGRRGDLLVVVDDAELLPAPVLAALGALTPHLRHAEDLGVALVLARSVTGWLRASYEPLLQSLRDTSPTTLLLAGDAAEGPIVGAVRARRDPPGRGRLIGRRGDITHVQVAAEPVRATGAVPSRWRAGVAS